ncbi:MAG: hypothetical protein ABW252_22170 [Polyangiales bacterium]
MIRAHYLKTLLQSALIVAAAGFVTETASAQIVRDEEQPGAYSKNGPFQNARYNLRSWSAGATVYHPTSGTPPYSAIVFCPPFTGSQPMYAAWGPFFASHGIIMVTMDTRTTGDSVDSRAGQQQQVVDLMIKENTGSGPLAGKIDTSRIGVTGWSMGGGATWISASVKQGLKTAMSLAGHNMTAINPAARGGSLKIPTIIFNGSTDATILGGMGQSSGVFRAIPNPTPKVIYEVSTAGHFSWGSPQQASNDVAVLALAFQKAYLDGDLRWTQFIKRPAARVGLYNQANIDGAN